MGFFTRTLREALLLAAIGSLPSGATAKTTIRDLGRTVDVGNVTYYIPGNSEVFHPCLLPTVSSPRALHLQGSHDKKKIAWVSTDSIFISDRSPSRQRHSTSRDFSAYRLAPSTWCRSRMSSSRTARSPSMRSWRATPPRVMMYGVPHLATVSIHPHPSNTDFGSNVQCSVAVSNECLQICS